MIEPNKIIIKEINTDPLIKYRYGYYNNWGFFVHHREDGPAEAFINGLMIVEEIWCYKGLKAPVSSQKEFENWLKLKNF